MTSPVRCFATWPEGDGTETIEMPESPQGQINWGIDWRGGGSYAPRGLYGRMQLVDRDGVFSEVERASGTKYTPSGRAATLAELSGRTVVVQVRTAGDIDAGLVDAYMRLDSHSRDSGSVLRLEGLHAPTLNRDTTLTVRQTDAPLTSIDRDLASALFADAVPVFRTGRARSPQSRDFAGRVSQLVEQLAIWANGVVLLDKLNSYIVVSLSHVGIPTKPWEPISVAPQATVDLGARRVTGLERGDTRGVASTFRLENSSGVGGTGANEWLGFGSIGGDIVFTATFAFVRPRTWPSTGVTGGPAIRQVNGPAFAASQRGNGDTIRHNPAQGADQFFDAFHLYRGVNWYATQNAVFNVQAGTDDRAEAVFVFTEPMSSTRLWMNTTDDSVYIWDIAARALHRYARSGEFQQRVDLTAFVAASDAPIGFAASGRNAYVPSDVIPGAQGTFDSNVLIVVRVQFGLAVVDADVDLPQPAPLWRIVEPAAGAVPTGSIGKGLVVSEVETEDSTAIRTNVQSNDPRKVRLGGWRPRVPRSGEDETEFWPYQTQKWMERLVDDPPLVAVFDIDATAYKPEWQIGINDRLSVGTLIVYEPIPPGGAPGKLYHAVVAGRGIHWDGPRLVFRVQALVYRVSQAEDSPLFLDSTANPLFLGSTANPLLLEA